ncbi:MAG: hypothetical protein U0V87_17880 [Acidobacteriota bacterium]
MTSRSIATESVAVASVVAIPRQALDRSALIEPESICHVVAARPSSFPRR